MHGIPKVKVRTTAEQQEIKRKEREKKLIAYRQGMKLVSEKRKNGEFDEELLNVSSRLLAANPDIATLWNIRREVLLWMLDNKSAEENQQAFEGELHLTEVCLRENPKSYYSWFQRQWVLENMPSPNWKKELALCNKYLDIDDRNFHTWDYRQIVVKKANVPLTEELAYSTEKIISNFSNHSSWHYRSQLLPHIFPDPKGVYALSEKKHKEELGFVQNAAFTDPNDQSAWFYLRWLLGRTKEPLSIRSAYISEDLIAVALSHSVILDGVELYNLQLHVNKTPISGTWKSTREHDSHVWIFVSNSETSISGEVFVHLYQGSSLQDSLILNVSEKQGFERIKPKFESQFSPGLTSVLKDELESCFQLLDLEPDSKWTLLTTVSLMQAIDRKKYKEDSIRMLTELTSVDKLRSSYYKDLRSRYAIEYAIDEEEGDSIESCVLSNLELTAFYHAQHFMLVVHIDLSGNFLHGSLGQLHTLQRCETLLLNSNKIQSLSDFPSLPRLKTLHLKSNLITNSIQVTPLQRCKALTLITLSDNPIADNSEELSQISTIIPGLKCLT